MPVSPSLGYGKEPRELASAIRVQNLSVLRKAGVSSPAEFTELHRVAPTPGLSHKKICENLENSRMGLSLFQSSKDSKTALRAVHHGDRLSSGLRAASPLLESQ